MRRNTWLLVVVLGLAAVAIGCKPPPPPHPTVLAKGQKPTVLTGFVMDKTQLYWIHTTGPKGSELRSISKQGGNVKTLFTSKDVAYLGLAIDDDRAYLSGPDGPQSHRLVSLAKAGGAASSLAGGGRPPLRYQVTVDKDVVYYNSDKSVMRVPKAGGAATVVYTADTQAIQSFALDAENVYVSRTGLERVSKSTLSHTQISLHNGACTMLFAGRIFIGGSLSLVSVSTGVSLAKDEHIKHPPGGCPLASLDGRVLTSESGFVRAWGPTEDFGLLRKTEYVMEAKSSVHGLAADDTGIYAITSAGDVLRQPPPPRPAPKLRDD